MEMDEIFITNAIVNDVTRLAQSNTIGHALKGLLETIPCESFYDAQELEKALFEPDDCLLHYVKEMPSDNSLYVSGYLDDGELWIIHLRLNWDLLFADDVLSVTKWRGRVERVLPNE